MGFKKYDGSTWQSINPKKLKGIPYTGTLPAVLAGTKAGYLHKYKIYGNTEQVGTPTPSDPIYPSECGERTENLCYKIITNATIDGNGRIVYDASFDVAVAPVYQDSSYSSLNPSNVYAWFMAEPYLGSQSYNQSRNAEVLINKTSPLNGFVAVRYTKANSSNAMIVEGSTPLPYEPYGYKLPLLSGSTPVDIYLGESQTTRRIKKLVLTGGETWYASSRLIGSMFAYNSQFPGIKGAQAVYCSHLPYTSVSLYQYGTITTTNTDVSLWMFTETQSSAAFKAYLQQQYANGTPVTVWYVLATEETGILNEPLRKIGNYVDTIDSTQTTAQIPTTANSTTISWGGQGLEPSEFDSIQEWVDIPTYKRVNGEWVADNSN